LSNYPEQDKDGCFISVVVATYNRAVYLAQCINGICNQSYPIENYEVIVVDDGSKDNTPLLLKRYQRKYPQLRCVFLPENHGVSYARNRGVEAARGHLIAYIDSDCVPMSGWLARIEELCRGKLQVCLQGTQKDGGKWGSYNLHEGSELIHALRRLNRLDTKNLVLQRDIALTHRFDETLVASVDIDLGKKLIDGGISIQYDDSIWVTHYVDAFSEVISRAKRWGRGQAQIYRKYGGWGSHTNRNLGRPFLFNFLFYFAAFWYQLLKYRNLKGAFARMILRIIMAQAFKQELSRK
jgi:glycosyltransferase involved in cell wall biosynthesis